MRQRRPTIGERFHGARLLFAVLLAAWSAAYAQPGPPQRPILLERIELRVEGRVSLRAGALRGEFATRPVTPQLRPALRERLQEQLKARGYYFGAITRDSLAVDSLNRRAVLYLEIDPGAPLALDSLAIVYRDSIPQDVRDQVEDAVADRPGRIYTDALATGLVDRLVTVCENNGYPLARVGTAGFDFREGEDGRWLLDLTLAVTPGDSVRIAYLRFPRQKSNLSGYLQRVLRFRPDRRYDHRRVGSYRRILGRQEFIKQVSAPELLKDRDGRYFVSVDFEETPATTLDGIIGYIPPPATAENASGYFTGLINIGIRNVFGGGRKLQVFWQKPDSLSDEFRVGYREPFLFGLPFHGQVEMYRLVRDVTFIEWEYTGRVEFPLNDALSAFLSVANRTVVPNEVTNRFLGLPRTTTLTTESGIRWDARDSDANPRRGVQLELAFSLGRQKNDGPDSLFADRTLLRRETIQQVRGDIDVYLPTFRRQVLANSLHFQLVENQDGVLRLPDQVWFGGATSIRGFREAQFVGRQVVWVNSEYRFILGPQSRFFLFTDNGWYRSDAPVKVERWLSSFGVGLRFTNPLGVVQVDFGMERGSPFQEGKLHFRLINEF